MLTSNLDNMQICALPKKEFFAPKYVKGVSEKSTTLNEYEMCV